MVPKGFIRVKNEVMHNNPKEIDSFMAIGIENI